MNVVDQVNSRVYPNALAQLQVSVKDYSIKSIGTTINEADNMAAKNKDGGQNKENNHRKKHGNTEIDLIWKHLGLGNIDISYACCGYTLDGRPILNQDELTNLLINYGFTMPSILEFIDDFAQQSMTSANSPIIMYSANTAKIMTEIESILEKK